MSELQVSMKPLMPVSSDEAGAFGGGNAQDDSDEDATGEEDGRSVPPSLKVKPTFSVTHLAPNTCKICISG